MIGIAVGGGATLIFFIFAIINIIIDEVQRHADLKNEVAKAIETLTEDYDVGEDMLAEMLQEFELEELKGDAFGKPCGLDLRFKFQQSCNIKVPV